MSDKEAITVAELRARHSYMLKTLRYLDETQLLELFHDLENIEAVERIADCAYHFVETFQKEVDEYVNAEKTYEEDAKEVDDCQRYRDIKSS